ncbi:3837_t:CDS:2 [Rhizophagus irregularis]|nr:3837_t:CDS:2 [Rhizophagus irregularis]
MTYNFDDNDTENNDSTSIIEPIDSQNSIFSLKSNIVKYESPSFKFNITTSPSLIINNILFFNNFITKFFKELLKELYTLLLDIEFKDDTDILNIFINNFLFDYDLDPKNVLEIMTSNSQNIFYYSSLIGFFYQNGIGCEVDEIKAFEIFSNSVKNNQKALLNHFTFDQKNESIKFEDGDYTTDDKFNIFIDTFLLEYDLDPKNVLEIIIIAKCYRDGIGTDKNLKEATTWIKKYELSKPYFKPYITLYKFLDGADIDVSSIASHTRM